MGGDSHGVSLGTTCLYPCLLHVGPQLVEKDRTKGTTAASSLFAMEYPKVLRPTSSKDLATLSTLRHNPVATDGG